MKKYVVFSLRVANELIKMGHQLIDTSINLNNPQYKVFIFADSEILRNDIAKVNSRFYTNY